MNKKELIDELSKKTELSKTDTANLLNAFTETVTKELKKGGRIQLVGFGTFETANRAARVARNPQTGKEIKVKASRVPRFKAGKSLKEAVKK